MKKSDLALVSMIVALGYVAGTAMKQNVTLRSELGACITQIDSITATRQVQILEVDSMIVLIKRPYVEPDN